MKSTYKQNNKDHARIEESYMLEVYSIHTLFRTFTAMSPTNLFPLEKSATVLYSVPLTTPQPITVGKATSRD